VRDVVAIRANSRWANPRYGKREVDASSKPGMLETASPLRNQSWRGTLETYMRERKAPRSGQKKGPMTQEISDDASAGKAEHAGRMEPELQDHIGRQLRAVYDEILEEPVPERFRKLLADLQDKQSGGRS